MHGIIMNQLQHYVVGHLGRGGWRELTRAAGVERDTYNVGEVYPDQELVALVMTAIRNTGTPLQVLLEDFGAFLAPALHRLRCSADASPSPRWRSTIDPSGDCARCLISVVLEEGSASA